MRLSVIAACVSLSLTGISAAGKVHASIRQETSIPAEGLGPALHALAKERNLQIVYVTEEIANIRTQGAAGIFTTDEALKRLLLGTGLTYRYLDEHTVTIGSVVSTDSTDRASQLTPKGASEAQEGKGDSSRTFRVAQANSGMASGSSSMTSGADNLGPSLNEIVVRGRYEFLSVDTSGTTGLPLPIEKVPQSISLVTSDFIEAADLKTLGEIAEYTPGAVNLGNQEGLGSVIELRGFTAGRSIDGINVIQSTSMYEPDYAIFDRLEIVKGPASVVYGVSSPGGDVNFVTKSATTQTPSYVSAQFGMWDNYRVEAQVAGALDSSGKVRGIGVAVEDVGGSFMNQLFHKKTSVYGGLNVDFTDTLSGYLHAGYERFVRPSFDGIPTEPDGSPAPLARSFCICSESLVMTSEVYHAEGDLTWHASEALEFSIKGNYQRANTFGALDYSYGLDTAGDLTLEAHHFTDLASNYGIGISSIYHLDGLGFKNSFVSVGALYQSYKEDIVALTPADGSDFGAGNIFAGEASLSQNLLALSKVTGPLAPYVETENAHTLTVSAQSVVQVIDPVSLLMGLSYSKPDLTVTNSGIPQELDAGGRTSYRAGLTYEFLPRTNAYASFSQSFNVQTNIASGTGTGGPLPPLIGNQYEVGVKYRTTNDRLLLTGALFQLKEKNLAQFFEQIGSFFYYQPADVRHQGLELQALGQLTPQWQINVGFSYLDPTVTRGLDPNTSAPIHDQTEVFQPKQTASFYTIYSFKDGVWNGFSLGGGPRYVSHQRTAYDDSTKDLPGYVLMDASASYSIDKWLLQLNGHNIFNKQYFINNYQTLIDGNMIGEPFNVSLSIRRKF